MVEFDIEEVDDNITYGSANKIRYSSIDWVDRDTLGMETVGGKEFNFCNKFFVGNGIVLTCGKPQDFICSHWIPSIHMHMRCILIFLCLKNFGMQMMSSRHMEIAWERLIFLMEGVLFSMKSKKNSLVLYHPMMGLMHPHLWWTHFAESCFTINYSTHLWQPTHIGMKIGWGDFSYWCHMRRRRLPHIPLMN